MVAKKATVFISYASPDKALATRLASDLRARGLTVWVDSWELRVGDNLIEKIETGLKNARYIVVLLSRASVRSPWVQRELSALSAREISREEQSVLPALVEDCEIPGYLSDRVYADFRGSYEEGLAQLLRAMPISKRKRRQTPKDRAAAVRESEQVSTDVQLRKLRTALRDGDLSLFCGAGISVDAGIPSWVALLRSLIGDLFRVGVIRTDGNEFRRDDLAAFYQDYFNPSALMIAQYLKNSLGKDFLSRVRAALYASSPVTCDVIDVVVELCRPQRSRQSLRSIVTYNFDDLLEQRLLQAAIRHQAIFREGQRHSASELPIYHVHGFLPQKGRLTPAHEIVFSEDAYHSQFMDPFSWANLVQLNHLNSSTCLFIGVSVTDPNLRRLLDVSMRKNPDRRLSHYVFRRRYDRPAVAKNMSAKGIKDARGRQADAFAKGAELLEEQDSNNMGLNVIWIDKFEEIPAFMRSLLDEQVEPAG